MQSNHYKNTWCIRIGGWNYDFKDSSYAPLLDTTWTDTDGKLKRTNMVAHGLVMSRIYFFTGVDGDSMSTMCSLSTTHRRSPKNMVGVEDLSSGTSIISSTAV